MSSADLKKIKSVPKWTALPILLSLLVHLVAGGTIPQYWNIKASYRSLESEINRRYQPMKIEKVTPLNWEKQEGGKSEVPSVDEVKVDISQQIEDLTLSKNIEPTLGESGFETKAPEPTAPVRKMWSQEHLEVVRRKVSKTEVVQDITGMGSPYSNMIVFNNDAVTRVAPAAGQMTGSDEGQEAVKPLTLDESLLSSGSAPEIEITASAVTTGASAGGVVRKDVSGDEGFSISLDATDPAIHDTTAQEVLQTKIPEPLMQQLMERAIHGDGDQGAVEGGGKTDTGSKGAMPQFPLGFSPEQIEAIRMAAPLAPHVKTEMEVYREAGNPQSFFRLTIRANDNAKLPVIRKNVLFVVDISLSVKKEELEEVKKAVRTYLTQMHPEDKFNVVRFSEEAKRAFYTFVPPTPRNVETGLEFIKKVPGQVKTDVYEVLHAIILNIFSRYRPCHVFLVTDGKSTQGVRDTQRIVRDIAPVVRSNISIYTVDIGSDGNRYLLDLVAYRSRGELIMVDDPTQVEDHLVKFAAKRDQALLMNLSVNYANLKVEEVYPQILPNLYSGQGLVIYGQCEPGKKVAIQIYGQSDGGQWKRFFYPTELPDGSGGDPSIAREWARGKIHYLVAKIAREGDDPALIETVKALGHKYDLPVPFSEK